VKRAQSDREREREKERERERERVKRSRESVIRALRLPPALSEATY